MDGARSMSTIKDCNVHPPWLSKCRSKILSVFQTTGKAINYGVITLASIIMGALWSRHFVAKDDDEVDSSTLRSDEAGFQCRTKPCLDANARADNSDSVRFKLTNCCFMCAAFTTNRFFCQSSLIVDTLNCLRISRAAIWPRGQLDEYGSLYCLGSCCHRSLNIHGFYTLQDNP